ncbi:hypothetical protein GMES_3795 [Paraglaciecola mesophila KMM 241]|uniref:Uncharacterized protein n=2 Tax=Paraglaciecola mesophila TaxID=197222 RepID=K6ZRZ6_9ALTE|nr:hypothetical protein GMES_3795 [Paraglaciecola mesophila KMM 241]
MSGLGEFHQGRVNTEPKPQIQKNQLKSSFECLVPVGEAGFLAAQQRPAERPDMDVWAGGVSSGAC